MRLEPVNLPEGFGTITPYLFVKDANAFGEFVKEAFGLHEVGRTMRDDIVANLMLRIGTTTIMASEASDDFPPMPTAFYLYVEDADVSMARALEAETELVCEAMDMDYGDRQGGVRDPFGNLWWISQRLVDEPYH